MSYKQFRYIPKDSTPVAHPKGEHIGVAYCYGMGDGYKLAAIAYHGKANKPDWHYTFRDDTTRQSRIEQWFRSLTAHVEYQAERRANRPKTSLTFEEISDGQYLTTAQTASLVRQALARKFPGVKFSVRSDEYSMGSSIDVTWTNGPSQKEVDAIASQYESAGFDGMIDMKFSWSSWLKPDLTATIAKSPGTTGSRGYNEPIENPRPEGAKLVHMGADYVQCQRETKEEPETPEQQLARLKAQLETMEA